MKKLYLLFAISVISMPLFGMNQDATRTFWRLIKAGGIEDNCRDLASAIKEGADVNSRQRNLFWGTETALIYLCDRLGTEDLYGTRSVRELIERVKILLTHGANTNLRKEDGITALMVACQSRKVELVDLLLKAGADVNATTNSSTVIDFACGASRNDSNLPIVRRLLEEPRIVVSYKNKDHVAIWNQQIAQIL